jgi:predicted DNA-binding transcriptional regulator YafY
MGLAPAAESPNGDLLLRRPTEHRTAPRPRPRPVSPLPPPPTPEALLGAVQALRASDAARLDRAGIGAREQAATGVPPTLGPMDPAMALTVVRDAAAVHRPLWIGYVDGAGVTSRRLIDPVSVDAGRVTAFDRGAGEVRTFSVHRITGVADASPAP